MDSITSKLRSLVRSTRPTAGTATGNDSPVSAGQEHRSTPTHRYKGQPYRTSSVESQHSQQSGIDYTIDFANNSSISANKLVDKLLDYLRETYVQPIDPYVFDKNIDFKPRKYVKLVITSGTVDGLTNFERVGDSYIIRSAESDLRFRLCSHILVTDIVINLKFCATFAPIKVKRKDMRVFCERCVLYVELALDLRPKKATRVTQLKLISISEIECRSGGILFPFNKSIDSLVAKVLHNLCKNFDQYSPDLLKLVNMFCQQYLDNIFKLSNFTELFM